MKLGACSGLFSDKSLDETLDILSGMGIEGVEIYSGGRKEDLRHIDADAVLGGDRGAREYLAKFESRGMFISALNCSGNAVHPNREISSVEREGFRRTVLLAERLGVNTVITFSGTPGGAPGDATPNWVTCPWPDEFLSILEYQWDEVLVPYWLDAVSFARDHGVSRIGLEMHPGFCVYNADTLFKLRSRVGPEIGVNFDPSHLMWNGVDPAAAILALGDAVFSAHAKDVYINEDFIRVNGVNDAKHYENHRTRAWTFRTVGYGHGEAVWKSIISAMAAINYEGTINIEHEDLLMSRIEGLRKASSFLAPLIIQDKPEAMWWA
jgi:sugar phosphate isomerase/epimerase